MSLFDHKNRPISTDVKEYRIGSIGFPMNGNAKSWQALAPRDVGVVNDIKISPLFIAMWIATSENLEAHREEIVALKKELEQLRVDMKNEIYKLKTGMESGGDA